MEFRHAPCPFIISYSGYIKPPVPISLVKIPYTDLWDKKPINDPPTSPGCIKGGKGHDGDWFLLSGLSAEMLIICKCAQGDGLFLNQEEYLKLELLLDAKS
jgi:hypothetical protein